VTAVEPSTQWDVVVVGGGIAGSALATVLAVDGYRVIVLERQTAYRDKVRGEVLCCWGVAEALRLDLEKPLLDAGGSYAVRHIPYDEIVEPEQAEAMAVPLDRLLPGVPGAMGVGHPEACESLARAAADAGATVVRGVGDVDVAPGDAPVVRYAHGDAVHELRCRLVVGADGRMSTVRRRLGFALHQTAPRTMGGGMLVDGLHAWPSEHAALGTEGDLLYFVFPRAGGRVRLYFVHDIAQRGRFAGPDREAAFLAAYGLRCIPGSTAFRAATPAGPCIFYPMNDSWTDRVSAPGVVLVGDAAGWNDPIIGQGLSIALRDVRIVADVLRSGPDWSEPAFTPYAQERRERMRRLRVAARVTTDIQCTFTQAGAERRRAYHAALPTDPVLAGTQRVKHLGPESAPAEAFAEPTVERIRALA
jgi:2-polyprenyl-6-methoxyphenol hydroxylase-like FAD-dependent oxidoreductase